MKSPARRQGLPEEMDRKRNQSREADLNRRPSGYEPDELPDCSIPQDRPGRLTISGTHWSVGGLTSGAGWSPGVIPDGQLLSIQEIKERFLAPLPVYTIALQKITLVTFVTNFIAKS